MKRLTIGVLAHVDAGKTTLAEAMLYHAGAIRRLGRVDHKDTFLDNHTIEKERGITVFSKQAELSWKELSMTLLDTPGHTDFSAEAERTLQVLDYAILIISGSEGIQSHTKTLWNLLTQYQIPTFIFINKMDMPDVNRTALMSELTAKLSNMCVDFSDCSTQTFYENCAMADESGLEYYLEHNSLRREQIISYIKNRLLFPCFFGSALKLEGITELLDGLCQYTENPVYPEAFGARIYKLSRDIQGNKLAHMKLTGGSLKVKSSLMIEGSSQKADQLRIYSGEHFEMVDEVFAGMVCAVKGLENIYPGMGLGTETSKIKGILEPVLDYRILPPDGCDSTVFLGMLKELAEEDPSLHVTWKETLSEIHIRLMGTVQIEILKRLIFERFGLEASFDEGSIMYKETIAAPVEGIGHFEPLKHYAEVHLLLEPLPAGSGLLFASDCREDILDKNWQRLILTHLAEREHPGVLTGSSITDMRITLLTGKAHFKHTQGGDFRQAAYRAVRQGLKSAASILLEPIYRFTLELPAASIGRAMSDIEQMHGHFDTPEITGDAALLTGTAPVASMQNYQTDISTYTKGAGKCYLTPGGYAPCHNAEEIINARGYDSEQDTANPASSVFCAHGAGFIVPWDQVQDYMHVTRDYIAVLDGEADNMPVTDSSTGKKNSASGKDSGGFASGSWEEDRELEAIFNRTFRSEDKRRPSKATGTSAALGYETANHQKTPAYTKHSQAGTINPKLPDCLLVDGYNVIFAWPALACLAKQDLGAARNELKDILCNYQGFQGCTVILVFDAYKVKGNPGTVETYHNIHVVYTKEAETADMYIEKTTHENNKKYNITVATSDGLEQLIVMGQGAKRISSRELAEEIKRVVNTGMEQYRSGLIREKNLIPVDWQRLFEE